ncbi:MAG TPA: hypothetical protein VHX66_05815 [Solirubrobacteraceae bacterium]|jgi:hypothetical protein|nr:hypothetical protein [Solirubrobacteraceae bacterium]
MRRAVALAAAAALLASGCETTQELSARIGRSLGHQSAVAATLKLGAANRQVRVLRSVLLGAAGQSAVAVELSNPAAHAQAAFPVLIAVKNAGGETVYRNDSGGIEPSLQHLALLPAHSTGWWVDNEVLATAPTSVSVAVGASAAAAPSAPPVIATGAVSASASFPGPHVSATVSNRSAIAQRQLAVYVVILHGKSVVGAGRAIVTALGAHASTNVVIPVIGSVDGHTISLTAAPEQLH